MACDGDGDDMVKTKHYINSINDKQAEQHYSNNYHIYTKWTFVCQYIVNLFINYLHSSAQLQAECLSTDIAICK